MFECVFVSYLTVRLGSCVTPQVRIALVPLMTLWSCGGVVIRVRAAEAKGVAKTNMRGENSEKHLWKKHISAEMTCCCFVYFFLSAEKNTSTIIQNLQTSAPLYRNEARVALFFRGTTLFFSLCQMNKEQKRETLECFVENTAFTAVIFMFSPRINSNGFDFIREMSECGGLL